MKTVFSSLSLFLSVALLAGCGNPGERVEITQVDERSEHRPAPEPNVPNKDRFRFASGAADFQMAGGEGHGPAIHGATPDTWTELPPTEIRAINLTFGPNGEGECTVSFVGGSTFDNANRWREQMGLPPYSQAGFDALPRHAVLGAEAVQVDFEGSFTPMGEAVANAGYRMTGFLIEQGGAGVYIKMVGPAALVEAEMERFEEFVDSLHSGEGHTHADAPAVSATQGGPEPGVSTLPAGHPPIDEAQALLAAQAQQPSVNPSAEEPKEEADSSSASAEGTASAQGFAWTVPAGWEKAPDRSMRLVTYLIDGDPNAECYVSLLGGSAGGEGPNINRWLGQFGKPNLSNDEIATLPKIPMLGKEVGLVETSGDFTTMQGEKKSDQALLGVAWISDEGSVFIKLTGSAAKVQEQKDAFIAFCQSFKREL